MIAAPAPARADPAAAGTVAGVVLDRDRPAPDITVTLLPIATRTTTDRAGRFTFTGVPPGAYTLEYRTPGGGMTQTSDEFTVEAGDVVRQTEAIGPHGALAGRVLDNHGTPVGGARIASDMGRSDIHADTDAQGRFLLDYLPPGAYRFSAQRAAAGAPTQYVPRKTTPAEAATVPIDAGRVTRIEERLLPLGVIEGTFTGPDGPLDVYLSATSPNATVAEPNASDGTFRLYLWPGDYRLRFEHGTFRHQQQWATGAIDEADATVFHVAEDRVLRHDEKLLADGTIGGRLLDWAGAPVPGPATVELTSTTYETVTATTDSDGYWSASAFPGDYRLRFSYQNRRQWADDTYRVLPRQRTAVPDQTLAQPGDVRIAVTLDGEPVPAFCVGLRFGWAGAFDFSACTDDGTVVFEGLSPYDYYSYVSMGWNGWTGDVVTVTAGRSATVTMALTTAAR